MELTGCRNKLMSSIMKGLVREETVVNRRPSGGGQEQELHKVIHHSKGVLGGGLGVGSGEGDPEGTPPTELRLPRPREHSGSPHDPLQGTVAITVGVDRQEAVEATGDGHRLPSMLGLCACGSRLIFPSPAPLPSSSLGAGGTAISSLPTLLASTSPAPPGPLESEAGFLNERRIK